MSALLSEETPVKRMPRSSLHAVPDGKKSGLPKAVFPVTIMGLLALGLVGHLFLQTTIQADGFRLASLQAQSNALSAQQAILQAALDKQSTPQQLAYSAANLGMVVNPYTTYINMTTGEVSGVNKPVTGTESPIISAPPTLPQSTAPVNSAVQAATPDQQVAQDEASAQQSGLGATETTGVGQ